MTKPNKKENDKLELALRKAFSHGEAWALTYATWFYPSKEDTEEKIKEAIKSAKRILRS
jgi:hypothetical protein